MGTLITISSYSLLVGEGDESLGDLEGFYPWRLIFLIRLCPPVIEEGS